MDGKYWKKLINKLQQDIGILALRIQLERIMSKYEQSIGKHNGN